MKWQQFVMDEFLRIEDELVQVLKGLPVADLNIQPVVLYNAVAHLLNVLNLARICSTVLICDSSS